MGYESTIISAGTLTELDHSLELCSKEGWIVRAGWFGSNRHHLALQRTPAAQKEEASGTTNNKGRGRGSKASPANTAGK